MAYDHYNERGGGSQDSDEHAEAPCSKPTQRIKISGNKKRVITSSSNARPITTQRRTYNAPLEFLGTEHARTQTVAPARVRREDVSVTTLKYYGIPYEIDNHDPDYLVIHQRLSDHELDVMREHSRRLRDITRGRPSGGRNRSRGRRACNSSPSSIDPRSRAYYPTPKMVKVDVTNLGRANARLRSRREQMDIDETDVKRERILQDIKRARLERENTKARLKYEQAQLTEAEKSKPDRDASIPSAASWQDTDDDGDNKADSNNDDDEDDDDSYDEEDPRFCIGKDFCFDLDANLLPSLSSISDTEVDTLSDEPLQRPSAFGQFPIQPGPVQEMDILATKWLGSTFDETHFSAQLSTMSAPPAKRFRPYMRWVHLERSTPSFEEFIYNAQKVVDLRNTDRRRLQNLLARLQRDNERQRQHGRDMTAFCEADVDLETQGSDEKQTGSFCCISIPFFALEKHASGQTRSLPAGSPDHPSRPLLQSHTRILDEKREMAQAVCSMQTTPQGHCLHVQNVWCLVVNEKTIVTCSKVSRATLGRPLLFEEEIRDGTEHSLRLRAGRDRAWCIPPRIATSLPTFVSTIADEICNVIGSHTQVSLWDADKRIEYRDWKQIITKLSKSDVELTLTQRRRGSYWSSKTEALEMLRGYFVPPVTNTNNNHAPGTATARVSGAAEGNIPSASSLKLPSNSANAGYLNIFVHSSGGSQKALEKLANALHQSLLSAKNVRECYKSCAEATQHDIEVWLQRYHSESGQQERRLLSKRSRQLEQQKETLVLLTGHIFGFFWDLRFDHILTRKFWGALKALLDGDTFLNQVDINREYDAQAAKDFTTDLYDRLFSFIEMFQIAFKEDEHNLRALPEQFCRSWLSIQSALAVMAAVKDDKSERIAMETYRSQLWQATTAMSEGETILVGRLRKDDIEEFEVCSTRGILALVLDSVTRDIMNDRPDVPQTYNDYCRRLEAKMLADPLSRAHQETLRALQQELEAIMSVLEQQLKVVTYFESSVEQIDDDSQMPDLPMLRSSRLFLVLQQCKANISSRLDQFDALQRRASELGEWHLGEIATNRDRQEASIMVFTIVTIIFLPLSFVASVFGMNTVDIRDMTQGQWAYWAAAVPLTILVVGGSLWFAGAFDNFRSWWPQGNGRFTSRGGGGDRGGYYQIQEPVPTRSEQIDQYLRKRTSYPVKRCHVP